MGSPSCIKLSLRITEPFPSNPAKVLELLSHSLTNKFLHAPTQALNSAQADERDALVAALSRLYEINLPE